MNKQGLRRLEEDEVEGLYTEAVAFIRTFKADNNIDIRLASRGECELGREALICPIHGLRDVWFSKIGAPLRKRFPGSDFHFEILPSGARAELVLNIWIKDEYAGKQRGADGGYSYIDTEKPSTEFGMFLVMVNTVVGAIIWYRLNVGISGF